MWSPTRFSIGPLLFIIYTNDLPNSLFYSKCILFADDTTLYHAHTNKKTLQQNIINYVLFLGIYIDDKLDWGEHIQHISTKISSGAYAINKSKRLLSLENLKLMYYSLVHSHLNYGAILWGAAYHYRLNKLEKLQKRFAVYVMLHIMLIQTRYLQN